MLRQLIQRLEDEFHLRLELERQARDQAEGELLRRTARQEKMRKALEMASEAAETKGMAAEDARSAIPVREDICACRQQDVEGAQTTFKAIVFELSEIELR